MNINSVFCWNLIVDRKMIKIQKWFEFVRKLNNLGNVLLIDSRENRIWFLYYVVMKE